MYNEEQLIIALKGGSEPAFKTLVDNFQQKVLNTCLGFVPNMHDAEDVTQEVFLEVYRSIDKFRKEARLSTWIYRIAVSKSLEYIRHRKRKKRMAFFQSLVGLEDQQAHAVPDVINHPGLQIENKERGEIIFKAIGQLADNQRIAFVLNKVEGLSYQEVAEVMDVSLSSVESLLHRARKNLQKNLHDYYKKEMQ